MGIRPSVRGSSPRMRGAHLWQTRRVLLGRIIPADAGSTQAQRHPGSLCEDHPRGCGEHPVAGEQPVQIPGSSPQKRGTHLKKKLYVVYTGTTVNPWSEACNT